MKKKVAIVCSIILVLVAMIVISRAVQYSNNQEAACNTSVSSKSKSLTLATTTMKLQDNNLLNNFYRDSGKSGYQVLQYEGDAAIKKIINPEQKSEFDVIVDMNPVLAQSVNPCSFANEPQKWSVEKWSLFINEDYFNSHELPEIKSSLDLRKPEFKNLIVLPDQTTDSGLAFFLTTVTRLGDLSWQNYWRDLSINKVDFVTDVDEMSFQQFGNPDVDPSKFPIALLPDSYSTLLVGAKKIEGSTIQETKEAAILNHTTSFNAANEFVQYLKETEDLDADFESTYSDEVAKDCDNLLSELIKVLQNN